MIYFDFSDLNVDMKPMDSKEHLVEELKRLALSTVQFKNRIARTHPRLAVILQAVLFFTFVFILFLHKIWRKSRQPEPILSSNYAALRALLSVSTPTSFARLSDLQCCSEFTRTRKPLCLEINLLKLLDTILAGQLELRDPHDIRYLIKGQLRVYGWSVEFYTDTRWSIKVMKWIAEEHLFSNRAYVQRTRKPPNKESILLAQYSFFSACNHKASRSLFRCPKITADYRFPYFDLDFVHYVDLKAEIGRIKLLQMQAGSTITIEFSCLAGHVGFSTKYFMLCAVPFVPRALKGMQPERTPTALLVRTADIISHFSAGPLVMESFTNISHEHGSLLQLKDEELINNAYTRGRYIQNWGKAGWREERSLLILEAGLLLSGLLTRWRLILRK